jgi:nicotinamide-nucleotide amidase
VSAGAVRAGILVTGTEVLAGRVRDRNGPWISERLEEFGVEVTNILAVGDRAADLEAGLRFFADQGLDLVVTSGGLGPTADDLTAEVVGAFAGRRMVLDESLEEKIAAILAEFARRFHFDPEALREANRKQAMVPEGATTVDPAGTAPGLVVPAGELTVIVMPGPPRELHAMWPQALATAPARAVLERAEPYRGVALRLFGIPESEIAKSLREIAQDHDLSPLEITTCLRRGELEVDIRHRAGAEELSRVVVERIREAHGERLFSDDGSSIDDQVAALLAGRRIGIGESCTGGLLAARLTERPGASEYVAGGVVAYSDAAKSELLGVQPGLIETRGAVSPEVAEAMAAGAIGRFDAELGVGLTGIAGPAGGSKAKPVGYVCLCVKDRDGRSLARDPVIPGDRAEIRDRSTTVAMHMIRNLLRGEELPI